ncbi:MAG: TonB-dependent receptor [Lunatimonas sp.]|uniref:TonB-dependent receptor domain-containing protein n=1 Tax=Lunatimonas sp. TaxID=2060141 RepID=UPI00263B9866|nr:TonB-dependent receptor [Lunatimonas sp.]MCC5938310.1 TonB-dependent receptor [Lunatimonas sp.]
MYLRKRLFLSLLVLFFGIIATSYGQETNLSGRVRDAESGKVLEFANVALLLPSDSSVVTGATANLDGDFSFSAKQGQYLLRVGYIGYESLFRMLEVTGDEMRLGNLRLQVGAETLDEVTVSGVTSMFESDIDKRTYNVENSILAEGATASELLNTLPSIQMDEEGGISMRGSGNVLIYINGRPTNLSSEETESILAQFPANSIKSVELITNPSSRYDAQGVGGIINIILKKDQRVGLNGQVNVAAGTRHKYQTGFNLNYGGEKVNFYTSYNYQYRDLYQLSESLRRTNDPNVSPYLDQDFDTRNWNHGHLFRIGFDQLASEKVTWGMYGQLNYTHRDRYRLYNQRHQNTNRELDSLFVRTLREDQAAINIETGITFDYDVDTLGQKVYGTLSYAHNNQDRTEFFDQLYFNSLNEEVPGRRQDQIYGRPIVADLFIGQIDYTKPFKNGGRLESGLKTTWSLNRPAQTFDQLDLESGLYVQNDTIANRFDFDEYVHAGYTIYRNRWERFAYQAGLRAEYTSTEGFDHNSQIRYPNSYFNLFPSLYITYELGDQSEFILNYSRRINRPSWGQMAPFYNAQDLLNTRLGNPTLQPEYTDSYEVGLNKGWEQLLFTGTLYHRRTQSPMTRIISLLENNSAVQLWDNANYRRDTGLELINQMEFHSNLDATLTGNFFYSEINGYNIRENFFNSNFTWTVTLLTNWVIPDLFNVQVMADYRGPIALPQGEIDPIYGLSVGLRRDLFNRRATVSLNVSDVFNTRVFRIQTDDFEFSQNRFFNQETRIGTLSFTYRFGGFKAKEEKPSVRYSDDPF